MKKILLVAAVACMTMTSCKKDYTCECTATVGTTGNTTSATTSTTIHDKQDAAKTACEKGSFDSSSGSTVAKTVCAIK